METTALAFGLIFDPYVLGVMLVAGMFGLFMGAIPGLSATMATALLVPVTFFMDPVPALAAIVAVTAMAIFAGDIPGALLRMPGTPASAAYCDEAYAMTRKGKAELVMGVSLTSAVIGGIFGSIVLATSAPLLAEIALKFSSFEYFWLACIGLTCAAFVSSGSAVKGLVSLLLGLFIATIGLDPISGHPRFTFGSVEMLGGINFIPVMIGMFALAEVIRAMVSLRPPVQLPQKSMGNIFSGLGSILRTNKMPLFRGSLIGTAVGALPGAGSDIAAWIAYATSKKFSKTPEKFGTGHPEGIVSAGAANNAGLGGAWVPALVFGIPGDSITAIVIGVLYMKGMNPGPTVFLFHPELIYAVFLSFFVANLMLLPLGFAAIKTSRRLLSVPREVLMPVIALFCIVGAFAINNTVFDVGVMLALGLLAWGMEENGFPIAPAILGLVLGPLLEENFMTSMIKADGVLLAFFERPIAAGLGILTLLIWASPMVAMLRRKRAG
ncbi:MAG: putative tricarboxylic transport membrane protein [Paracoccaceae bacterium]|jgi:putative tricarboxylic transport membrane protein